MPGPNPFTDALLFMLEAMTQTSQQGSSSPDAGRLLIPAHDFLSGVRSAFGERVASEVEASTLGEHPISAAIAGRLLTRVLFAGAGRCDLALTHVTIGEPNANASVLLEAEDARTHPLIGKWLEATSAKALFAPVLSGALLTSAGVGSPTYGEVELIIGPEGIGDNEGVIVRASFTLPVKADETMEVTAYYGVLGYDPPVTFGAKVCGDALYRLGVHLREPMNSLVIEKARRSWPQSVEG
jgi:hypothetical protein